MIRVNDNRLHFLNTFAVGLYHLRASKCIESKRKAEDKINDTIKQGVTYKEIGKGLYTLSFEGLTVNCSISKNGLKIK